MQSQSLNLANMADQLLSNAEQIVLGFSGSPDHRITCDHPIFLRVISVYQRQEVRFLCDRFQHVRRRGVVAEGLTHVDKEIFISGSEDKAAAEL